MDVPSIFAALIPAEWTTCPFPLSATSLGTEHDFAIVFRVISSPIINHRPRAFCAVADEDGKPLDLR